MRRRTFFTLAVYFLNARAISRVHHL